MVLPGFLYPPIFVFVPAAGEVAQLSFNSVRTIYTVPSASPLTTVQIDEVRYHQ